jgi:hypothetical protein
MMTKLGIPLFNAAPRRSRQGHPGENLMTMNEFLWGDEPSSKQLELLNKFDTVDKVKAASRSCQVRNLQMMPRYLTRHTGSEYKPTNWRI